MFNLQQVLGPVGEETALCTVNTEIGSSIGIEQILCCKNDMVVVCAGALQMKMRQFHQ